jgi:hypothetical protein
MAEIKRHPPSTGTTVPDDPWGETLAQFLTSLLPGFEIELFYEQPGHPSVGSPNPVAQSWQSSRAGPSPWTTTFALNPTTDADLLYRGQPPSELGDLPDAAMRAVTRLSSANALPSGTPPAPLQRALFDMTVAEILAERTAASWPYGHSMSDLADLFGNALTYCGDVTASRVEAAQLSHGVVVVADPQGLAAPIQRRRYPFDIDNKRSPLLFDGSRSLLSVDIYGTLLGEVTLRTLETLDHRRAPAVVSTFTDYLGANMALVPSAASLFDGIGLMARPDQIWVFDRGIPQFVKRGGNWRSIPLGTVLGGLNAIAPTADPDVIERCLRSAVRLSIEGHGAIIALIEDLTVYKSLVNSKDIYKHVLQPTRLEERLHSLLRLDEVNSVETLTRLASIDGATALGLDGQLLSYGAVVASTGSTDLGARTAAAQHLSRTAARFVLKVSQDGPIAVFYAGRPILEFM